MGVIAPQTQSMRNLMNRNHLIEVLFTVAQQVAHTAQTVDWFIDGGLRRPPHIRVEKGTGSEIAET